MDYFIPEEFRKFFWDVRIKDLNIKENKVFIIERLLNEGDEEAVFWLFRNYSSSEILNAVTKIRGLSLKTARCMQNYFDLKEEDFQCIGESWTHRD